MLLRPLMSFVFAAAPAMVLAAPLYLGDQEVPDDRVEDALDHCRSLYLVENEAAEVDTAFVDSVMEVNGSEGDEEGAGEDGSEADFSQQGIEDQDDGSEDSFALADVTLEDCKQAGLVH